jgi:oxygen-independent coproporphyrinogen III oxidase
MVESIRPTAGLYIHIPFCKSHCLYCDFYSEIARPGEMDKFIDSLCIETSIQAKGIWGKYRFDTVFIGGGTPSILNPVQITSLFTHIRSGFDISSDAEITIECNPSSVTMDQLGVYRELGINRISLGIQSFNNNHLKRLGRLHDSAGAANSVKLIRGAGFENINFDLIFGIPGQTLFDWNEDLKQALKLGPTHLSAYNLIIEQETPFGQLHSQGKLKLPSEELQCMMYNTTQKHLSEDSLSRYEISNFAKSGYECRHNLKYWYQHPYLGLGPSAFSFDGMSRIKNDSDLAGYLKACSRLESPPHETEPLDENKLREEMIMMRLRLTDGLPVAELKQKYGYDILRAKAEIIDTLLNAGYISIDNGYIKLTTNSLFISDEIIVKLI